MNWRDRFTSKGSFRGAGFVIKDDSLEFGRRVIKHEFPLRDDVVAEDMGKKSREHSAAVFVIGDDYLEQRDALMAAIEKPGAGSLVHPYFGTINVTISSSRVRHSTGEGGYCQFSLTFFITPPAPPLENADTQADVELSFAESITQSIDDFSDNFDMLNEANDLVQGVIDDVDSVMDAVENVVSGVTSSITKLITAPFEMGTAIMGAFSNIKNLINNPLDAFNIYSSMFGAGNDLPAVPTTTPSRQQQSDSIAAVRRIVQQGAVASACLISSEIEYDSLDDAVAMRDVLLDAIDDQMNQPMAEGLYAAFADLRAAVVVDLRIRGMQLPRLVEHTPQTTLPALVIAHRLYGDATRESELVARNKILHPGFIQGGQALEVLANV